MCKKIFFIKAKNTFFTGCPKSGEGVKVNKKKIIGASAKKHWVRSQIFRYRLPEDFLSKWQKS